VSCAEGVGENGKQQLKAELVGMLTHSKTEQIMLRS